MPSACTGWISRVGRALILLAATAVLAACAPTSSPTSAPSQAPTPAGPKTLVMALQVEPLVISLYGRPAPAAGGDLGGTTGARFERYYIFHANLTMYDEASNVIPAAA